MRIIADRIISFAPIPEDLDEKTRAYLMEMQSAIQGHLRKLYDSLGTDLDLELASDKAFYLGEFDTDGSWRLIRSGNDLVIQRRESGTWTTKSTVNP